VQIALAGDTILNRKWSNIQNDRFNRLIRIFRESDVSVVNLETVIHTFKGYPESYNGQGTPMHSEPVIAKELADAGINLVSFANNHSYDYGPSGVLETIHYLSENNVSYAGAGSDEESAKTAATAGPNGSSVGLIGAATSFTPWGLATASNHFMRGKPGIYGIRLYPKPGFLFELIFNRMARLGNKQTQKYFGKKIKIFGRDIEPGTMSGTKYSIDEEDRRELLHRVKDVKSNNSVVIISIHSHQGKLQYPPGFLIQVARDCIDSGADIVFSHGTHVLRGIEIYKKRPIFYGLGNFCFQVDSIDRLPADAIKAMGFNRDTFTMQDYYRQMYKRYLKDISYWQSIVPVIDMTDQGAENITLYPIILNEKDDNGLYGTPRLASRQDSTEILEKLIRLSKPFKTRIDIKDISDGTVGVIGHANI
jgi:poly-gamma-glutamate capsule biosynthesis protein CapA/YwtB (metallophosphatase superfamily)